MDPNETNQFAATPETASEGGWNIVDGGQERETAEQLADTLRSDDAPQGDEPVQPEGDQQAAASDQQADGDDKPTPAPVKAKPAQTPAPKGKRTMEGRVAELRDEVNTLTRTKYQTRREAEQAQRELADLHKKLEDAKRQLAGGSTPASTAPDQSATPSGAAAPGKPAVATAKPVWKEFDEAGKSWDDYLEAQEAYLDARIEASTGIVKQQFEEQLERLRADSDAQAHQARVDGEHKARIAATRTKYADEWPTIIENLKQVDVTPFLEDVIKGHPNGGELYVALGRNAEAAAILSTLDMTREMFNAAMASDDPSALLIHLATEEGEFDRIRQMPASAASYALGVLSARLSSTTAPARENGPRPKGAPISKAAPPIRPVGAGSTASVEDGEGDEDGLTIEQWVARENKRDREKARTGAY